MFNDLSIIYGQHPSDHFVQPQRDDRGSGQTAYCKTASWMIYDLHYGVREGKDPYYVDPLVENPPRSSPQRSECSISST